MGKDGEIWLNFIKRDIPDWQNKRHEPKDPQNWWKVYRKLKQEAEMDISAGEDKLKAALANIKIEKEQNLAQLVSRKDMPRPQVGRRQRITYNYMSGKSGSKSANKMSLIEKIRKEAREAKMARMSRPTHELHKSATVVTKPPQQFVDELKQKAAATQIHQPPSRPLIRAPRPALGAPQQGSPRPALVSSSHEMMQEREARLRGLKSGNPKPSGQVSSIPPVQKLSSEQGPRPPAQRLSSSFLEDSEDEPEPRKRLNESADRPKHATGISTSSPQPGTLKRKQAPSLFMSTPKKVLRRPEGT